MLIENRLTKKFVKVSTAIKQGLFENPKKFNIPDNYVIRKDNKKIIAFKTAKKLINEKKLLPDNVVSNEKIYIPKEKKFVSFEPSIANKINEDKKFFLNEINNKLKNEEVIELKLGNMPITDLEFIKNLSKYNGRYTITIGNKIITLNEKNRIELQKIIKDNLIYEEEQDSFGDITIAIKEQSTIKLAPVRKYESQGFIDDDEEFINIKKKRSGAFFKHVNLTNIDLSRYGIYKTIDENNYKDNCLIHALNMGGLDTTKLNQAKLAVKNRVIAKCKLEQLCDTIKCKLIIKTEDVDNKKRNTYGKQYEEEYNIGLLDDHYFIIEKVDITSYALQNYFDLYELSNFNYIFNDSRDKNKSRIIDSYDVIKILLKNKNKLIREMTLDDVDKIGCTPFYNKVNQEILNLEYNEETCIHSIKDNQYEEEDDEGKKIIYNNVFFDFETHTTDDTLIHKPYLCRTYDGVNNLEFFGEDCGYKMLCSLKSNTRLIAHNITYDFNFIFEYIKTYNCMKRGNHIIGASGKFKEYLIQIKDSYNLISHPLRSFKNIFNLDIGKEVMNYDIYNNKELFDKRYLDIDFVLDNYIEKKDHKQFLENINKWNLKVNNTYDIIEYSNRYCEIDCKVLYDGYTIFRKWILESFEIDIDNVLTSASLAHKYLIKQGCYNNVYQISGVPQRFISNCVVGGRTMVSNNEKIKKENIIINDFDAVSLYPSAMSRMKGFLKGKPKVIENLNYNYLSNQDGYFVDVKILKVGIHRNFPLMSFVNDEGIRIFTNAMENQIITVDKTSLEDLIKFHKIEFEIVRGYFYNEGFNNKINKTINYLFDERLKYKALKNPVQEVYKLIMNSAYGKSIMKEIETEDKYIYNKKDYDIYLRRNYVDIKSIETLNEDSYILTKYKSISDHKNIPHVGVSILSMSKRIMNEVMCLAEDEKLNIYYQDTDSMHIEDKDIKTLVEKYKTIYKKDLIGEKMGQFHSDFEFFDDDGNKRKDIQDIKAIHSIFLGKKCYIDKLQGKNKNTGEIEFDYHVRMKGIPEKVIYHTADTILGCGVLELYERLYKGEEISFDLTMAGKRACFQQNKNMTINTKSIFTRNLKF